jgi:hypothetical protein
MGSAGQSQGGGSRVYPGKKMAGRMGGQQVTVQNVKVLSVDTDAGLVVLRGEPLSTLFGGLGFGNLLTIPRRLYQWAKRVCREVTRCDQKTVA